MLRTFLCVEITNPETIPLINTKINELSQIKGIRTVKPTQLHLTLKFLGDVTEKTLVQIKNAIQQISFDSFNITLEGMGCFPNQKRIRVIWIGISQGKAELKQLASLIEQVMVQLGFPKEKRPFSPHLTIGRVKYLKGKEKLSLINQIEESKEVYFGSQSITNFILKKSTLSPKGAIYDNLIEVSLN
ncbi:MAG: RNA 2',3'-cyclic phosphodiesterase [Candidatus Hodarchaeales archaeon]|jgi:2'-5' RNA ligase